MKKRIIALLMATIMAGGVLTGCGGEKETTEPNNDKETVVEESTDAEVEAVVEETKDEAADTASEAVAEETKEEMSLFEVFQIMSEDSTLSADGKIVIYTTKIPETEDAGINENTLFDVLLFDRTASTISKAFMDEGKTISTSKLGDITLSETPLYQNDETVIQNAGIVPIDNNEANETITNVLVAYKNEADEVAYLAAYFGNDITYVDVNGHKYTVFKTVTTESGTNYVYYTALDTTNAAFDGGVRLYSSFNDDDGELDCVNRYLGNYGGLTDCDPSVASGDIKTPYITTGLFD